MGFQIRLDEIDFNGHLHSTKYLECASHTRYCQLIDWGWGLRAMQEHDIGAVVLSDEIRDSILDEGGAPHFEGHRDGQ
jgi:acyl-CoA thioester hydrolase